MKDSDTTRWAVDSLVVGEGGFFSHGWVASPTDAVVEICMTVRFRTGEVEVLPAQFGLSRNDVANTFPGLGAACGYIVHAALTHQGRIDSVSLEASMNGGERKVWVCPIPRDLAVKAEVHTISLPWRRLLRDGLRVPKMIWMGKWGSVVSGARTRLQLFKTKTTGQKELTKILNTLSSNAVMLVDHSLGGGANLFRERQVAKYLAVDRSVVVWTFVPYLLKYELRIYVSAGSPERRCVVTLGAWDTLANSGRFSALEFNNCVSFPRQADMGSMLVSFKNASKAKLSFLLHDYHMVCPSYFLLNDAGRYCELPDIDRCRKCLPNIQDNLLSLFAVRDIDSWRTRWRAALLSADEIIHFSDSTRRIFLKAYPELQEAPWVMRPHQVPDLGGRFVYPRASIAIRLAVVGHIGHAKGSGVVLDLARLAKRLDVALEIIVIGTIDGSTDGLPIHATGHYKHADLAILIKQHNIHMALMSSVYPETFSYVTHELMQLDVPIMCFDLGAQAEVVRPYAKGCVIALDGAEQLLLHIQKFKQSLDKQSLPITCD